VLEAGSVPLRLNFPQLDLGEPSSGFTLGFRSASLLLKFVITLQLHYDYMIKLGLFNDYIVITCLVYIH
jgi:hypothetical protein